MSRNYSRKTFLRQTPNRILKEYFSRKNLLKNIDFDSLGETDIESISQALDQLSEKQGTEIEADFRLVNEMAYGKGIEVLVEEANWPNHKVDLSSTYEQIENHYGRAFWFFLNYPLVFEIASRFDYMDRAGGWQRRYIGERLKPAIERKDLENLEKAVSDFYRKQGRGRHCKVDNYLRYNPERHCYFAYPEDYATTEMEIDEKGEFCNRPRKPVFEVIFVYKPEIGDLEVCAKGGQKVVEKLQIIFCQTILGLDSLPDKKNRRFDLSKLKDKDFHFVTEPQDGIEKVTIKMLRLDLPGGAGNRSISFEASSPRAEQPVRKITIQIRLKRRKAGQDAHV
ncbi:MAG: hypothetical protein NTX52_13345 [Planctomycetota bacterium]|nr:hypothetical protein [Planctomycetota bacterium]